MATTPGKAERAYAAAHFAFELDGGEIGGIIRSIEGGGVKVDNTSYRFGGGHMNEMWRQLAKPKFEAMRLQVGMSMAQPFNEWISTFFTGKMARKSGAIVAGDFTYKERARREFTDAIIEEIKLPALNAADKSPAYLSVTIAPEKIVFTKGSGKQIGPAKDTDKQKLWTTCHFRFTIDGFDDACKRVNKVEPITIKQKVVEHHVGGQLEPFKLPSRMEFEKITFFVPEVDFQPIAEKMQRYWNERQRPVNFNGSIEYLDNELKVLATLSFTGANIADMSPEKSDAQSEDIKTVKVDLFAEAMELKFA